LRLILVISLVSILTLVLLAGLTLVLTSIDVANLTNQREETLAHAVDRALAESYRETGSWSGADLASILTLAAGEGIAVNVVDNSGDLITRAVPEGPQTRLRPPVSLPITVDGKQVGTLTVRVGPTGIFAVGQSLRGAVTVAMVCTAAVVAVIVVISGTLAARRIIRSVESLTRAARRVAAGERGVHVGDIAAPGELADLSRAFDYMSDTLERQDQLRRTLVADIAHELRTPLAVLQASTEALADGITEPDADALYSLRDETLRLSRFIEDLEVLASAEAAGLTIRRTRLDLARVASRAADAMEARVAVADLTLVRSLEPVTVKGDEMRLHQVVTNLLSNAAKFTSPGGCISLTIRTSGDKAEMIIADTGAGIPAGELQHIFERFWRGESARHVAGSGIGLAVVAELVQANGGQITVASSEGHGTQFTLAIPLVVEDLLQERPRAGG